MFTAKSNESKSMFVYQTNSPLPLLLENSLKMFVTTEKSKINEQLTSELRIPKRKICFYFSVIVGYCTSKQYYLLTKVPTL